MDQVINSAYPATLALANSGKGITPSSGTTLQYSVDNTVNPATFCITATKNNTNYKITNDSAPVIGDCTNYGLALSFDPANTSSYPGSGTSIADLSINANNGTLVNGVIYDNANNGVLILDGVNDFVRIPNSSTVSLGSNSFSVSMWFKMNSIGTMSASILMNKENAYESSAGGGRFTYAWQPYWVWVDAFAVNIGEWYNAVIVYDKVNQYVYKNGLLVFSRPQTGIMGNNSSELDIGARGAGTSSYLPGTIGPTQIYNRPLSAADVLYNFNAIRGRYGL